MKKYVLHWGETESCLQSELAIASKRHKPVYQLTFDNKEEALEAFQRELATTSLTKYCDLDFNPTDHEFRTNCCALLVTMMDDEDDQEIEDIESSEYYWIED